VRNNRPDEGKSSWDVMFEVMIPLQQSSRRAREREAEYMLMAAEARREDAKARASGELGIAWSMYAQGRETFAPARTYAAAAGSGYPGCKSGRAQQWQG